MTDFYKVLEVDKTATNEDIRRAYRRLSMKWHPDRNKSADAEDKFKELSVAYSVISDVEKRNQYDRKGEMFDISSVNIPDIFKVFMGSQGMAGIPGMAGMSGMSGMQGMAFGFPPGVEIDIDMGQGMGHGQSQGQGQSMGQSIGQSIGQSMGQSMGQGFGSIKNIFQNMRKPPPIINNIVLTLKEAYQGISVPIKIKRWISMNDNNTKTYEEETIYLSIPAGVDENEIIITRDMGNVIYPDNKGDIKTFIKIENDTSFKRYGLDIDFTKIISLKDALCGFTFEIDHLDGICYKINNTNGTIIHPSYKKTINKKGMVRDGNIGNLNIHFIIEFPKTLSKESTDILATVL
jgi:DnaJ-class molecular chaperone